MNSDRLWDKLEQDFEDRWLEWYEDETRLLDEEEEEDLDEDSEV